MKIAIIENEKVTNIIEGEIETVSNLFPETIPVTKKTGNAWIGARFNGEKFEPKQIFQSWIWDESSFQYQPPKSKPKGNFVWSENDLEWVKLISPFPSWKYNSEREKYLPPVEYPTDGKNYSWDEETTSWVEIPQDGE